MRGQVFEVKISPGPALAYIYQEPPAVMGKADVGPLLRGQPFAFAGKIDGSFTPPGVVHCSA